MESPEKPEKPALAVVHGGIFLTSDSGMRAGSGNISKKV